MKKTAFFLAAFTFASQGTLCHAWEDNVDIPNPLRTFQQNSPNYNPDHYARTYRNGQDDSDHLNGNEYNDAPQGNDIRDYNPYFDRYGNLKPFGN